MKKEDKEFLEKMEVMFDDFEYREPDLIDKDKLLNDYLKLLDKYSEQLRYVNNVIRFLNEGNEVMTLYWDCIRRKSLKGYEV